MSADDIYRRVVEDYRITGSVKKTAENVSTTLVRAQRILITEGLWSSPTSENVLRFYRMGKTVPEIAAELFVSEKTVQAYLPYIRTGAGYGGEDRSLNARKSEDYRKRMQHAAASQVSRATMEKEMHIEEVREVKIDLLSEEDLRAARTKYNEEIADSSKDTDLADLNTEELYGSFMRKRPQVLKLELSLDNLKYVRDDDMEILKKYGRVEKGITREILVPADITLHALNYAILRAFGWQNSHLHSFNMTEEAFQKLTGGKNKPEPNRRTKHDGLYLDWVKLCGIYFRFPCEDFDDLYWDDDYEDGQSIKSWFRRKYTGPYVYNGNWENYYYANAAAKKDVNDYPMIRRQLSFGEWDKLKKEGKDPSKIPPEMIPVGEATIEDLEPGFEGRMDELLERIPLIELLIPEGVGEDKGFRDKLKFLIKRQENSDDNLSVLPVTKELIYKYDYGDGWEVSIKLTDCYYTISRYEAVEEAHIHGGIIAILDDKQALAGEDAFDMHNRQVGKDLALKIATVAFKRRPVCLALDGMSLMDDVGGIHGYIDFLKTIHGKDEDEKEEMKEWAKWMGWTGKMNKPETLI